MSAYADTKDWDPLGSSSLSSVISYSQLYNQIVQFDNVDTSQVTGDLAESWEINPEGTQYTFHLHDGIKWTDGEVLDADDVVSSMLRYANPCNGRGRSGLWRQYAVPLEVVELADKADCTATNADQVVRKIDDLTVEFNLAFASGAFIKFLAIDYAKVLPEHLMAQGIDLNLAENILKHEATSGPFILEEYQSGNHYKVNRNPEYFKEGLPYFDRIEHFIITTPATFIAQVEAGQIDMSNAAANNLTATENYDLETSTNSEYVAHDVFGGATRGLMLNIKKGDGSGEPPFNNHLVRQAINLAVDRQKHNERALHGAGRGHCPLVGLANSLEECESWPGMRPKDTPGGQEDIARARELMAEAGYPDGFEVQYTVRQVGTYAAECSVIKQDLEEYLGITGPIETLPSAAGYAKYGTARPPDAKGDWEIACQADGMTVFDVDAIYAGIFLKGATRNYTDWETPEINAWFEEQKVELDPAKRREINKEAERWLHDFSNNHWVSLTLGRNFWVMHRDIKGFNAPETVQYGFKQEHLWFDR
jgi:ABC-type transport system substrate-binding protein